MQSTTKLIVIFLYCLAIIYGLAYLVFFRNESAWWLLTGLILLPHHSTITRWSREPNTEDEE